jgi:hypothetical protein
VRCDNRQPECSRCEIKGLQCHYPTKTHKSKGQSSRNGAIEVRKKGNSLAADLPSISNCQEASYDATTGMESLIAIPGLDLANLETEAFDWNDTSVDLTEFATPQTKNETLPLQPPTSADLSSLAQIQQSHPFLTSIPPSPTFNVHWMVKRPNLEKGTSRSANLMFHTLKSYPLMLLRRNTFPPFIHPSAISFEYVENSSLNPLANCINLVHMIGSWVQGSRKLFWKNVGMECQRICEEVR